MTPKEMDTLTAHFNKYFGQEDCTVLHPIAGTPHIDALLYKPTEKYSFWKLASMGASDYKMNVPRNTLGNRNEYIMTIKPDEDMTDPAISNWYFSNLLEIALYPIHSKSFLTYGHSMEWPVSGDDEMVGAFLEFPQVFDDIGLLRCKLGLFKQVICLHAILLTRSEIDKLSEMGPEAFSYYLYPENGSNRHFLCERKRSEKF